MNPLDVLVAEGMRNVLESDLGKTTYRKIEKEVHAMYGMSMQDAAGDFAKLDLVMRKFFGRHTTNIESKILCKVLTLEDSTRGAATLRITDACVAKMIFEAYGNPEKKVILDIMRQPKSIPYMTAAASLPKASTYSRVRDLLNDGLLMVAGQTEAKDGRSVKEFVATLRKTVFDVRDSKIVASVQVGNAVLAESFVYNSIVQTRSV